MEPKKLNELHPCACKSLAESVQRGDEMRARCDALRVVHAALSPFDSESRGRIMRAVHELYEGATTVDLVDVECTCEPNERVPDEYNEGRCSNCFGVLG